MTGMNPVLKRADGVITIVKTTRGNTVAASRGSKVVIYAAIAGNFLIAVAKFAAGSVTGSSAMISEGVHSLVDTGNGMLLLFGIRQSQLPPTRNHPFGRGKELYFWTLVVAILIFAVGGGISIYEGIRHIQHPEPITDPIWNYIVLAFGIVVEGIAWTIALREFRRVKVTKSYIESIRLSKDPTTFTVLLEDSAALLGLVTAFAGVWVSHTYGIPAVDGLASVGIGLILAGVATFLAYECKGLLIGEGVDMETADSIRTAVNDDPDVVKLRRGLSMYLGPYDILLALDVEFVAERNADEVAIAIRRIEHRIRERHEEVRYVFVETQPHDAISGQ